ncbi:MAG: DUF5615 family PIN-like protein [Blastocatellia bacterium]|nr:DUF5615 family PIN-like protein [Blastocatellia bacterium]
MMALGHNVVRARQVSLFRLGDAQLLRYAHEAGRFLITRDKGFGQLAFLSQQPHSGVILLRVKPATPTTHQELERFLHEHADEDLSGRFVVMEPVGHRIRKSG